MTRGQMIALIMLGILFLVAAAIFTIQIIWGSGGLQLDQLSG